MIRKSTLLSFLLVLMLVAALPVFAQALTETLEIPELGLTMDYPGGWELDDSVEGTVTLTDPDDIGRTVSMSYFPNPGNAVSPSDLVDQLGDTGVLPDSEVEEVTVAGFDALKISGEFADLSNSYGVILIIGLDDNILLALFLDPQDPDGDSEGLFDDMIDSISVDGVGGSTGGDGGDEGEEEESGLGGILGGGDETEEGEESAAGDEELEVLLEEEAEFTASTTADEFTFEAEEGAVVSIWMNSEEIDTRISLLGPDGEVLAENDDAAGSYGVDANFLDSRIVIVIPEDGEYTIETGSFSGDETGDYTVTVTVLVPEEFAYGDNITVEISDDNPESFFVFEGEEGDEVTISFTSVDGEVDPALVVYNAEGVAVADNDDFDGTNSQVTFTVDEDGMYYVRAGRFSGEGDVDLVIEVE